ncbi:hypothetical protein GCM10020218_024240 [Dactylosporangium vinaceum]
MRSDQMPTGPGEHLCECGVLGVVEQAGVVLVGEAGRVVHGVGQRQLRLPGGDAVEGVQEPVDGG